MASGRTRNGVAYDSGRLDPVERRFWRDVWEAVPEAVAREHGLELRRFGPVQATIAAALPRSRMMNLVLGATDPGAVEGGHLAAAVEWATGRGACPCVPVAPGTAGTATAEAWLADHGFSGGHPWVKFVRDPHPPRFRVAEDVEVVELGAGSSEPMGAIAAAGFELPAWAAELFAHLPGREGWRCYVARVDGEPQACAAMLVDGEVAELGVAAALEPARGRGCQLALTRRRILDAAEAGVRTLFVETGAPVPGQPSPSYRNILRAGFEVAYERPNWELVEGAPAGG